VNKDHGNIRVWAFFCHFSSFLAFLFPLGNIVGPLAVWILTRAKDPFVDSHGKESLNFQISFTIYYLAGMLVSNLFFSWLAFLHLSLLMVIIAAQIVLTIIAAVRAYVGIKHEYPLTIRFLK